MYIIHMGSETDGILLQNTSPNYDRKMFIVVYRAVIDKKYLSIR